MFLQHQLFKQCIEYCNNDLKVLQHFNNTKNINECFQYQPSTNFMLQLIGEKNKLPNPDKTAKYGFLEILQWLENKQVFCTEDGAVMAALNEHLHILQWLVSEERGEHQVFCNRHAANMAVWYGHLHIIQWLASKERGEHQVFCDRYAANMAVRHGHLHILEWLASPERGEHQIVL